MKKMMIFLSAVIMSGVGLHGAEKALAFAFINIFLKRWQQYFLEKRLTV
ncbi:MAG TPA: hypothetical protein VEK38_00190 [Candidatus Bathyarchaeia archaeon]|nr:hypothetical protein [Candidatus Bathyarchaeia archaeon]